MTTRNVKVVAGLATLALLTSCSMSTSAHASGQNSQQHVPSDRKPAPDFTLQDANGASVKLTDYRGKVLLLNFWATWCGPCNLEIPWFEEFEQQYKSRGFEVLGVSMDDDGWKAVKPYVAAKKINYRIVLGNDSVTQLYGGVDSLPTTFVIDQQGRVAYVHVGLAGKNEYASEIQSLLGGHATGSQAALRSLPAALFSRTAK